MFESYENLSSVDGGYNIIKALRSQCGVVKNLFVGHEIAYTAISKLRMLLEDLTATNVRSAVLLLEFHGENPDDTAPCGRMSDVVQELPLLRRPHEAARQLHAAFGIGVV